MVPKRIFMQLAMVHRICAVVQWNWISTRCKVPWASLGGGSWKMLDFGWNFWRGMWNWNELKQTEWSLGKSQKQQPLSQTQRELCPTSCLWHKQHRGIDVMLWTWKPQLPGDLTGYGDRYGPWLLGSPKEVGQLKNPSLGPRKRSTVELQWNWANPPGPCEKKWLCKEQWGKSRPALPKLSYHHLIR